MKRTWILIALGLAILLVVLWALRGESNDAAEEQPSGGMPGADRTAHVNVVQPEQRRIRDHVQAVGSTRARDAVDITSEVDARVRALHFEEGEAVSEGELLVELDDRRARAEFESAAARLEDAEARHQRAQRLRTDGNISAAEADERRAEMRVARAEKARAQVDLENHRIHAPFDGMAGLRQVSPGAWLRAGDPVTTLDSVHPMELHFAVPERYLRHVGKGQTLEAHSQAWPDQAFEGEVTRLGSRVEPGSRNLRMKALLDNEDGRLRPGQFMTLRLDLEERDGLILPEEALLTEGRSQYVFVVEDGKARRREIVRGRRTHGEVEIREGLSGDEQVVINGHDRLRDGDSVDILEDPDALVPRHREGA